MNIASISPATFNLKSFLVVFFSFWAAGVCSSVEQPTPDDSCAFYTVRMFENYDEVTAFWEAISSAELEICISRKGIVADALSVAIQEGNLDAVKTLLQNGANPNENGSLISATFRGLNFVNLLLQYDADPNLVDGTGQGALHYSSSLEIERALLNAGADVSLVGAFGTPLYDAAKDRGSTDRVKQYLNYGAKAEQEFRGVHILFGAYHNCSYSEGTIAALIANGANPNILDNAADPNLYFIHFLATKSGCESDLAATITIGGVDVDWRTFATGSTPLSIAASEKDILKTIDTLHQLGANLNARDFLGSTPLHNAVISSRPDNVIRLLELGANAKLKNSSGKTAFDYADRIKGSQAYWLLNEARY